MVVRGLACQLNIKPIVLNTGTKSNLITLDEFKELQAAGPRADKQEIESALNHWRKKVEQSAKGRVSSSLKNPNDFIPTCLAIISELEKIDNQVASNGAGQPQSILEYLFGAPAEFLLTSAPGQTNPEAQWTWLLQQARSIFPSECAMWGLLVACKHDMSLLHGRIFNAERNECVRLLGLDRLYADLVHYCRDNTQYVRENKDGGEGKCWDIHKALNEESAFAYADQPWGDKKFKDESMLRGKESDDDVTKEAKQRLNKHVDDVISKGVQDVSQDGLDGIKYKVNNSQRLKRLAKPQGGNSQAGKKQTQTVKPEEYSHAQVLDEMNKYFFGKSYSATESFFPYQPENGHLLIALTKQMLAQNKDKSKSKSIGQVESVKILQFNEKYWAIQLWGKNKTQLGWMKVCMPDETASLVCHVTMEFAGRISSEYVKPLQGGAINRGIGQLVSKDVWNEALYYLVASDLGLAPKTRLVWLDDLPYWPFVATEDGSQGARTYVNMSEIIGAGEETKEEGQAKEGKHTNKVKYFLYKYIPREVIYNNGNGGTDKTRLTYKDLDVRSQPEEYNEDEIILLQKLALYLRLASVQDIHTDNYGGVFNEGQLWDYWFVDMDAQESNKGNGGDESMSLSKTAFAGKNNQNATNAFGCGTNLKSAIDEGNVLAMLAYPAYFCESTDSHVQNAVERAYFRAVGKKFWQTFVQRWRTHDGENPIDGGYEILNKCNNHSPTVRVFAAMVNKDVDLITKIKEAAVKQKKSPLKRITTTEWDNFLKSAANIVKDFSKIEEMCAPKNNE